MTIASYSALQTAISDWTGDTFTTAQLQQFIGLAEAKFNRALRTLDMETRSTASVSSEYLALPDDFLELRAIQIGDDPLTYATPAHIREIWANVTSGQPRYYTVTDGQFQFAPAPGSTYTVEIIYFQKIPALANDNTSNWLLALHPDLYLAQSLAVAETFGWNDNRGAGFSNTADGIIAEIAMQEKKRRVGSTPLKMKTGIVYDGKGMGRRHGVSVS